MQADAQNVACRGRYRRPSVAAITITMRLFELYFGSSLGWRIPQHHSVSADVPRSLRTVFEFKRSTIGNSLPKQPFLDALQTQGAAASLFAFVYLSSSLTLLFSGASHRNVLIYFPQKLSGLVGQLVVPRVRYEPLLSGSCGWDGALNTFGHGSNAQFD